MVCHTPSYITQHPFLIPRPSNPMGSAAMRAASAHACAHKVLFAPWNCKSRCRLHKIHLEYTGDAFCK